MQEPRCPCGKPIAVKLWEADLKLCPDHARDWLRSDEKKRAVDAIAANDELALKFAVEDFVRRVARERPWITRVGKFALRLFGVRS